MAKYHMTKNQMPGEQAKNASGATHVMPAKVVGANAGGLKYRNAGDQARVKTGGGPKAGPTRANPAFHGSR